MPLSHARRRSRAALMSFALWVCSWGLLAGWAYYLRWRRRQTRFATAILNAILADLTDPLGDQPAAGTRPDGPVSFAVWPTTRPLPGQEHPETLH